MPFKLELFEPITDLERVDRPEGRIYRRGDKEYNSVTTLLSKFGQAKLEAWKNAVGHEKAAAISRQAANRGTTVHQLCEDYLLNKEIDTKRVMPVFLDDFNKAKRILDAKVEKVYGVEMKLYSDRIRAAGTTDLAAEWGKTPSIVDFKNTRGQIKPDVLKKYFIQLAAYNIMVQERYKLFFPKLVIVNIQPEQPLPIIIEAKAADYVEKTVQIFDAINKQLSASQL